MGTCRPPWVDGRGQLAIAPVQALINAETPDFHHIGLAIRKFTSTSISPSFWFSISVKNHGWVVLMWLARLIGSGFKKGCVFLYYSSIEFESTLTVDWNGVGATEMSYTVQTLSSGSFLFYGDAIIGIMLVRMEYSVEPPEGHSGQFAYVCTLVIIIPISPSSLTPPPPHDLACFFAR